MPAKQSLAEKYALRQAQSYSQNLASHDSVSHFQSPIRVEKPTPESSFTSGYTKARSPRKSLAEKYETRKFTKRRVELPGAFGSPIKTGNASSRRPMAWAPPQLFKSAVKTHTFPEPSNIWAPADAKSYRVSKRTSTGSRVGQLARRITNYVASFTNRRTDNPKNAQSTPFESPIGSSSPKVENLFWFRRDRSDRKANNATQPISTTPNIFLPSVAAPRTAPRTEPEYDEVDMAIRERKHKQEQMQLQEEKQRLERQLSAEHRSKEQLREDYERKLYLQQQDYEAQIHTIREQSAPRLPSLDGAHDRPSTSREDRSQDSSCDESWILRHSFLRLELAERTRMLAEQAAATPLDDPPREKTASQEEGETEKTEKTSELQKPPSPKDRQNSGNLQTSPLPEVPQTLENSQPPTNTDNFNNLGYSSQKDPLFPADHEASEPIDTIRLLERTVAVASAASYAHEPAVSPKLHELQQWRAALAGETPDIAPSPVRQQLVRTARHLDLFPRQHAHNPTRALAVYSDANLAGLRAVLLDHRRSQARKLARRTSKKKLIDRHLQALGAPETHVRDRHTFFNYYTVLGHRAKAVSGLLERARVERETDRVLHAVAQVRTAVAALTGRNVDADTKAG